MNPVYAVAGGLLIAAWVANALVLRMRNWHRPYRLAFILVGLTGLASYLVLPQVTRASQSVLMPVTWVALFSLAIKLLVLGRLRGLRLAAATAVLSWLLEVLTLVVVAAALIFGVYRGS